MENIVEEIKKLEGILRDEICVLKKQILKKEKPFLTFAEACTYLEISKNTLYTYTSKSIIPHFKVRNRKIYFSIEDLNCFILNKYTRIRSVNEINKELYTIYKPR